MPIRASMTKKVSVRHWTAATCATVIIYSATFGYFFSSARADEGGVSLWLPGFFGSLAAAPQQPGWSLTSIYYHTSVSAGADVARAREFETEQAESPSI